MPDPGLRSVSLPSATARDLAGDAHRWSLDLRSPLPVMPTEAMVRQAEIEAAYLALEAARADPIYQAEIQAKAAEAHQSAHRLRRALGRSML